MSGSRLRLVIGLVALVAGIWLVVRAGPGPARLSAARPRTRFSAPHLVSLSPCWCEHLSAAELVTELLSLLPGQRAPATSLCRTNG